ncbi:inositol-pentakisphosphate 2-kinase [Pseudoneurospora amorphoporcata]|uniref:Inositol-pentakisphosphate 2-kinase n=1 Tax=Pseudoneurospora amorphoporcata TaxID=241081 RepID=A0AAN6P104_9PEZI|nr:inositol-pentakisphosphate 2-kinase [Pseudoneurospora amorphoporcata]
MSPKLVADLAYLKGADCQFRFIGEGAANIVFEFIFPGKDITTIQDDGDSKILKILQGKLLRVPKANTKAFPHPEILQYWESSISPLFDNPQEDLAQQYLVRLDNSIVSELNAVLEDEDAQRRTDFQGTKVAEAEYGMLVEDMRKKSPTDLLLEFKPKWLTPSPTATRCRNCAREAYRIHKSLRSASSQSPSSDQDAAALLSNPPLCPLECLAAQSSPSSLARVIESMNLSATSASLDTEPATRENPTGAQPAVSLDGEGMEEVDERYRVALVHWLQTNSLLPKLRDAQEKLDPAPEGTTDKEELALAMTLRDCTCFVRISEDTQGGVKVEAKLADLDKKNWEAKLEYWKELEEKLKEGGYYEGVEVPRVGTRCLWEVEGEEAS